MIIGQVVLKGKPIKRILLSGFVLLVISCVMLPFGSSKSRYWPILFPAFIIGTIGNTFIYINTSIAIFRSTPPEIAGTVGAIFNSALVLGSAIGISVISSIESNVEARKGGPTIFDGRAAGLWFLLGIVVVEMLGVVSFFREDQLLEKGSADGTPSSKTEAVEKL